MEGGGGRNGEGFERGGDVGCGCQVLACVDEAEVGRRDGGAKGEELAEGAYCCVCRDIEGNSCET